MTTTIDPVRLKRDFKAVPLGGTITTDTLTVKFVRHVPQIADLYLAHRTGDPERWFEFLDAVDPGNPREEKWVVMISTQFGCAMGCTMCDAHEDGFRGNISTAELMEQVRIALSMHPEVDLASVPKVKLHFARMGEPTLNPNVLECLVELGRDSGIPNLIPSLSSIAPATPKSEDFLRRLTAIKNEYYGGGRFQMQFSIHTTDEAVRKTMIPIRNWNFDRINRFGSQWWSEGDRLITLNFALSDAVPFDAEVIERTFRPDRFLLKFTPMHPSKNSDKNALTTLWYEPSERLRVIEADLNRRGFKVIINPTWREEIWGAVSCGQLKDSVEKERLHKSVVEAC